MSAVTTSDIKNEIEGKVDLIKRLYCKGASNDELELFMHACKRTGLDPFMKQIYAIKRGGQMTIQTGIDGLRLVAERTANYSPGRESTFAYDDKGILLSATSYIKKRTSDGTWHEVAATAYFDEYNVKYVDEYKEKLNLWRKMPRAMLSKCAEALALRKAFPAEMSGLYTKDEMEQADAKQEPMPELIEESPELPDIPLTETQRTEVIALLKKVKRREAHEAKIASFLEITDLYDILQSDYQRVIDYLAQVIAVQDKETKEKIA